MRLRNPIVIAVLACLVLSPITTQAGVAQGQAGSKLKITVLKGAEAAHNIGLRAAAELAVRVEDESGRPISGAVVVFQLPSFGAGGRFPGEGLFLTVNTDDKGEAKAVGLRPNGTPGKWEVVVTASHPQEGSARIRIPQVNQEPPAVVKKRGGSGKWIVLLAVVGGVGAGVAAAAGGGKGGILRRHNHRRRQPQLRQRSMLGQSALVLRRKGSGL